MDAKGIRPKLGLIVAMDSQCGIGKAGTLPWSLRKDMAHFKKTTMSTEDKTKRNVAIMGRKCWESIPQKFRPLEGRLNVVISRTLDAERSENLIVTPDFDSVMKELTVDRADEFEYIWNIGGAEIYKLALDKCLVDTLVVTKIHQEYQADVRLDVNWENFKEEFKSEPFEEKGTTFSFHNYTLLKTT